VSQLLKHHNMPQAGMLHLWADSLSIGTLTRAEFICTFFPPTFLRMTAGPQTT
jgi:hypothetical protein